MISKFNRILLTGILGVAMASQAAAQFPRRGVRLLANTPLTSFFGAPTEGSAIITYRSPSGREYAIMGATNGKHFFEITNPNSPIQVGFIATPSGSSWQEMAVVGEYCYGVSEHSATQIIDLTQIDSGIVTLANTWYHNWFDPGTSSTITLRDRAHTAQGNSASNTVYINGARDLSNPAKYYMVMLDVSQPTNPTVAGYWSFFDAASLNSSKIVYVHDCTVVNYSTGPWAGKEIVFACCGYDGLYILDATNKANVQVISKYSYLPANTYCHSGSLSPDKKYYYINDEFDEVYGGATNTTHIFNVEDLANPIYVGPDAHGNPFTDHNSIIQDNRLLVSSYSGGLRVFSYATPTNINEVGFFDTRPASDVRDYSANWGVAGELPSGTIVLSDRQTGLYVLDATESFGLGAVPISQTFARGSAVSGDFDDTRRSDNSYLRYQGTSQGFDGTVTVESSMSLTGPGSMRFEARSTNVPVEVTVQALNRTNGKWVNLVKQVVGTTDAIFTVPIANVAPYYNASGQALVKIKMPRLSRTTLPGLDVDALQLISN